MAGAAATAAGAACTGVAADGDAGELQAERAAAKTPARAADRRFLFMTGSTPAGDGEFTGVTSLVSLRLCTVTERPSREGIGVQDVQADRSCRARRSRSSDLEQVELLVRVEQR
jgi:hypothetical protein